MDAQIVYIIMLAIIVIVFVLTPKIIRLRIGIFRAIRWNWMADLHEKHHRFWTILVRSVMVVGMIILLFLIFKG